MTECPRQRVDLDNLYKGKMQVSTRNLKMLNQNFRVRSLEPNHPLFEEDIITSVCAIDAKRAVRTAIGTEPSTPNVLYAQVWSCELRKIWYFVSGKVEPLIYEMHVNWH